MNRTRRPTHPGIAFNELVLAPLGCSTEYAAKAMGVCQSCLESVLSGNNRLSQDLAMSFASFTGTSVQSWYDMQLNLDDWEREHETD